MNVNAGNRTRDILPARRLLTTVPCTGAGIEILKKIELHRVLLISEMLKKSDPVGSKIS